MVMNGYDTDGDGENNFYTVNGRTFYYAKYPIKVSRSKPVRIYLANLTEFDLINSFHLHGEFFRYYPTGTGRPVRVHRHRHAVPGPARRHRDRLRAHRPLHVPRAPVRVHRARLDGLLRRGRLMEVGRGAGLLGCPLAALGARAGALLAVVVGLVTSGSSLVDLVGTNPPPADEFDIRRVEFDAGRDPDPGDEPAARRADDRARSPSTTRSSRSRSTGRATLERLRSSTIVVAVRLGRERPDLGRRHELDRDRDGEGDPRRGRDAGRLRPKGFLGYAIIGLPRRRRPGRASACSGCPRSGAPDPPWLAAFMALTGGLLTFLGVEALLEALELQARAAGAARRRRGWSCSASRSASWP